jgi:hypothetical protein
MSAVVSPQPVAQVTSPSNQAREVTVYSHSAIYYWWPVWAFGYVMALVTYLQGISLTFGEGENARTVLIHPSHNLGVIFTFILLLVILITHSTVRGLASLTVIIAAIAVTLFFAYMNWWDDILRAVGDLAMFMNLGFYLFVSTALFIMWVSALFFFDRFHYYTFRPGQMVAGLVLGGGEETFDTHGMTVEKKRDDLFRHWGLGLGSGDLHIATTGAKKADFVIPNVLFIGTKVEQIQRLTAMKPDEDSKNITTAGAPA